MSAITSAIRELIVEVKLIEARLSYRSVRQHTAKPTSRLAYDSSRRAAAPQLLSTQMSNPTYSLIAAYIKMLILTWMLDHPF